MMTIEVNRDYKIDINESHLTVKDKRLYNTKTKSYEGIEGDLITFEYTKEDGSKSGFRGYVDGYTNGSVVKIRGIEKAFEITGKYSIEHISTVTDFTEGSVVTAQVSEI